MNFPNDKDLRLAVGGEVYDGTTAAAPIESPATRVSQIRQAISLARKRKWAILAVVLACFIVGLIITLLMTPQYTATAQIEIQRESQNFTNVEGADRLDRSSGVDPEYYQTQYGLLQSRSLAESVAADLNLADNANFFAMFRSPFATQWFLNGKVAPNAPDRATRIRAAGDILLKNVDINPERLSRLVDVSFTSPDPKFSKQIIDAWVTHFISRTLERRYEATSYARKFLEDRLAQLRTRIDESQRALVGYAQREGIINLPAEGAGGPGEQAVPERSLAADDLATLASELTKATVARIQAESRRNAPPGSVTEVLDSQAITTMRAARAELAAQYAKLMRQFEPSYPPAQSLQSQIAQLDKSIAGEEGRVRNVLDQEYRSAVAREQSLKAKVESSKTNVLDLRRRGIQYDVLQRDVDSNRQLYAGLLQRYKEIGVAGGVGVNNISVVDPAEQPTRPSSPRLLVNLALALFIGFGLGIGVALLLEQISDSIDDPAEVPLAFGVPLLGTTPKTPEGPLVELDDPKGTLSEAYFSLQTSLALATDHGFPRSLAVTSSRPGEAKSITSLALARSLARPDRRVLLIDADMRSPSVHSELNISNTSGLSNYLAGADDLGPLVHATSQPGFFAMAAGPCPPSAADLLSGGRMERLIADVRQLFDYVIFDSPPVMGLADAPLIANSVEGVVFMIEAHATAKSIARVAMARLRAANVRLLGVVVSKFDSKRAHYGYGYDYGYEYGYGDGKKVSQAD